MEGRGGHDSKQPAKRVNTVTAVLEMRSEGDERALRVAFMVACRVSHGACSDGDHRPLLSQTHFSPLTLGFCS